MPNGVGYLGKKKADRLYVAQPGGDDASFGITPELDAGEGIYEWDLTGKLANGDVQTAIKRSPFVLEDRIAQVS